MLFTDLLTTVRPMKAEVPGELEIQGLHYDSRSVRPGGLFFALRGGAADGHRFIEAAVNAGAAAVVVEDAGVVPVGVPYLQVADARQAMAAMADLFYGRPTAGIPVVGITGTNGKTTTTYLIEGVLAQAGIPAAVLGTVSYRFGSTVLPAQHTTPESVELQQVLRELVDMGAKGAVMEVSSHALHQHRVDSCRFSVGIFTNLTRDHLDYHHDMESYYTTKERLFSELLPAGTGRAVANIDDPYGERIARAANCPVIRYGLSAGADVSARNPVFSIDGIVAEIVTPAGDFRLNSRLMGQFNLSNLLAAVATGIAMNIPLEVIRAGLESHIPVPGRLERVENGRGVALLVDYAHTGDALENVLKTIVQVGPKRVITLFGCGGDRDRGKRPIMGEIAVRYSDLAIITSDNPRTEEPEAIIADIKSGLQQVTVPEFTLADLQSGIPGKGYVTVVDRREAIRLAVRLSAPGDIVVLAGKGHEDYQIVGKVKHHFDDREEAAAAFRECC